MPNPGQPTIGPGATGDVVRRLQRALRRTPDLAINVDGVFGPQLEASVKSFQEGVGLVVDGIVGPLTWNALPDGGPMPIPQRGIIRCCGRELAEGAHQWRPRGVGNDAARDRREFWAAHASVGRGLPSLGRCYSRRGGRRPDLVCVFARGECHTGDCSRPQLRNQLSLR